MKTLPVPVLLTPSTDTPRSFPRNSQRLLFEHLLLAPPERQGMPRESGHLGLGYPLLPAMPRADHYPPVPGPPALTEDVVSHPLAPTTPEEIAAPGPTVQNVLEAMPRDICEHADNLPSRLQSHESAIPAPVHAVTCERAVVDRVLSSPGITFTEDLQTLVDRLQLQVLGCKTDNRELTLLRARLPQLGPVEVHMRHGGAGLQVEIQAAPASLRQLQVACADLLDRLQRLDPAQQVSLGFAANGGGEQGSRNRRHVLDEWWPEP